MLHESFASCCAPRRAFARTLGLTLHPTRMFLHAYLGTAGVQVLDRTSAIGQLSDCYHRLHGNRHCRRQRTSTYINVHQRKIDKPALCLPADWDTALRTLSSSSQAYGSPARDVSVIRWQRNACSECELLQSRRRVGNNHLSYPTEASYQLLYLRWSTIYFGRRLSQVKPRRRCRNTVYRLSLTYR